MDITQPRLTVEAKRWMADQVNSGIATPSNVICDIKVHVKSIYRYAIKVRRKRALMDCSGRPRSLDEQCLQELQEYLLGNPGLSVAEINSFVRKYQLEVFCFNRNITINDIDEDLMPKKLSRRSIVRYVHRVVPSYIINGNAY